MTDALFDDPVPDATVRSAPGASIAQVFAERVAPEHWTAATLLAGLDRGFVSRAEIVRLFTERLTTGDVEADSWQERLAFILPDEHDDVRAILVEVATRSPESARHSDVRPWAFVALDRLRERWHSLSDPYQDIDEILFVLGEPPRYDVLRPWESMSLGNGRRLTLLATLDVVIAEDAQAFGTDEVRDEANARARASERLEFLAGDGLRLPGATRASSWLLIVVSTLFLIAFGVGWLTHEPGVHLWEVWPVVVVFSIWLFALLRVGFVGVFVTSSHLRVVSFLSTRRIPLDAIRSVGATVYEGMWWQGRDPLVSMLTLELTDGSTRPLPVTMASNRRAARLARRLSAVSGISLHEREGGGA